MSPAPAHERRHRVRRMSDVRPPIPPPQRGIDRFARTSPSYPRGARRRVVRAIRRGIENGEFELHYQPQIDIQTGRPYGLEALLRWRRRGELLRPARFLADAEASTAIDPLTDHVLELALRQAGEWQRAGRSIRLSINLSAANLHDFSVVRRIASLLSEHRVPPDMITVEVTETAVLDEPELARAVLDAVSDLGVAVSVDDFGTGYSSLLWLCLFPLSEVKIDQLFITNLMTEGEEFVSGVVRLGHDLGLTVVAEGIEDEATLERLQELGCDNAQGFLFAEGLPAGEIETWLDENLETPWAPKRKELSFSSGEEGLAKARKLIHETASELGYEDSDIWDMKLAATEALMNALEHGAPSDDGMVHLRLAKQHGDLLMEIWGGGRNGESSDAVDGSQRGRGIAIMTALMDELELRRSADDSLIRLAKRRTSPDRAAR